MSDELYELWFKPTEECLKILPLRERKVTGIAPLTKVEAASVLAEFKKVFSSEFYDYEIRKVTNEN